jgi:hypothetical protein
LAAATNPARRRTSVGFLRPTLALPIPKLRRRPARRFNAVTSALRIRRRDDSGIGRIIIDDGDQVIVRSFDELVNRQSGSGGSAA